jgi:hypothetical protein
MVELLKQSISSGQFNPFSGALYSQTGMVQDEGAGSLSPEEVMGMDWLEESIIGRIPMMEELTEQAKPVILQQGLDNRKG